MSSDQRRCLTIHEAFGTEQKGQLPAPDSDGGIA
jgi:hypothetical protein